MKKQKKYMKAGITKAETVRNGRPPWDRLPALMRQANTKNERLKGENMNEMYITTIEKVSQEHHRSPIIIHDGWQWYFAEFNNWEQLQSFLDFAGLEIKLEEEKADSKYGIWRKYSVNKMLDDPHDGGFWKIADLPEGAKRIKGHSNGHIVDCYIFNDGETLHVYRPNPNAKEVYKPLSLDERIKYMREHGGF